MNDESTKGSAGTLESPTIICSLVSIRGEGSKLSDADVESEWFSKIFLGIDLIGLG